MARIPTPVKVTIRERLRERIGDADGSVLDTAADILDTMGRGTAAGIARTIGGAITRASEASDNTMPAAPEAATENTVAIAEQLARDPVAINTMNAEPKWQSRIVIGLAQLVIAALVYFFGEVVMDAEAQEIVVGALMALAATFVGAGRLVPGLKPFRWFGLVTLIGKIIGKRIGV